MAQGAQTGQQECLTGVSWDAIEALLPIAVVIAAGCEPCATAAVERALQHGVSPPLVVRTLRIVAAVRSADCFARVVGPTVVAQMGRSLRAAHKALRALEHPTGSASCSC